MADPQPTDAHLRIAHSINEQMMVSHFSEQQRRILDFILRLSWGCGSKVACIPRQKDFEIVGVHEGHVKAHLDWLVEAKVITREGYYYQFNKDFDQWRVSRAAGYTKQRLTELVSLNLNHTKQKLTELVSLNLNHTKQKLTELVSLTKDTGYGKGKINATESYGKGKNSTPELASPIERGGEGGGKGTPPLPIKESVNKRVMSQRFTTFWQAYPKKKSKGQAEKTFEKVNPDEQLLATMLAIIERAKKSEDWQKEGGKYIPHPATWLNAKGWEDEFLEEPVRKSKFGDGW